VFSRYRIYHFEDFTCILPVSIDSGKTHHKSPAHSSGFRGFFAKCVWQIFKTGCTVLSLPPIPIPIVILTCFADLCSSGLVSQTKKGDRKGVELNMMPPPPFVKNPRKYMKKLLKIVLDYRCVQPVLRRNHTCVIPVLNFWRRWPHDPVSTHQ
jgi:hypothetical protein